MWAFFLAIPPLLTHERLGGVYIQPWSFFSFQILHWRKWCVQHMTWTISRAALICLQGKALLAQRRVEEHPKRHQSLLPPYTLGAKQGNEYGTTKCMKQSVQFQGFYLIPSNVPSMFLLSHSKLRYELSKIKKEVNQHGVDFDVKARELFCHHRGSHNVR